MGCLLITVVITSCKKTTNSNTTASTTTTTPTVYTDWAGTWVTPAGSDKFTLTKIQNTNTYLISNCWQWNSYAHSCYPNDIIDDYHIQYHDYQCGNNNIAINKSQFSSKYDTLIVKSNAHWYKYIRQ